MSETIQEEPKKKIIEEFMHTDEQGNPIIDPRTGKQAFTNLVADTEEEMRQKMREAYLNVTRALARARNHKPVPKETPNAPPNLTPEEERQLITEVNDPVKGRAALRKLTGVEDLEKDRAAAKQEQDAAAAQRAAYQFMSAHLNDYYPCSANSSMMTAEINAQGLDPRVTDNYEIAFNAIQGKLAQRPAPPQPDPPKVEEPVRQAAGGIQPGELSGRRTIQRTPKGPMTKDGPLTIEKLKWLKNTEEGRAEWKRRAKTDPSFYPAVNALLAKT
jgi:hypothetical protein